jgi:hypothetical protein
MNYTIVDAPSDDYDDLTPISQGLRRLADSKLMPRPIVDLGERERENGEAYGLIQHVGVLSAEQADEIKKVMGLLPYELMQVTSTDDGTVIGPDGKILSRWLHRDHPDPTPGAQDAPSER